LVFSAIQLNFHAYESKSMSDILIYGIGNPGRQDDSLGVTFATRMEDWVTTNNLNIDIEYNYQLNIEDAARISLHKIVIFADASKENIENFVVSRVLPKASNNSLSHSVNPESILFLCKELFNCQPEVYMVHIKGYEWELGKPVTGMALKNLELAFKKIQDVFIQELSFKELIVNIDTIFQLG
jgi:hydrogenase maturation protease